MPPPPPSAPWAGLSGTWQACVSPDRATNASHTCMVHHPLALALASLPARRCVTVVDAANLLDNMHSLVTLKVGGGGR